MQAPKILERGLQVLPGNPDAVVADREPPPPALIPPDDLDPALARRTVIVLDGVKGPSPNNRLERKESKSRQERNERIRKSG